MNSQALRHGLAELNWRRAVTTVRSTKDRFATLTTSVSIGKTLGKETSR